MRQVEEDARRQRSAVSAMIKSVSRGRCTLQLSDGTEIANVQFSQGLAWPVGSWVAAERVENDWQVVGNGTTTSGTPP